MMGDPTVEVQAYIASIWSIWFIRGWLATREMIDERFGWKPPLEGKVSATGWKNDSWLTPSGGYRHDCYDLINDNHCHVDLALTTIINHCFYNHGWFMFLITKWTTVGIMWLNLTTYVVGCNHDIHGWIRVILDLVHINITLLVDSLPVVAATMAAIARCLIMAVAKSF